MMVLLISNNWPNDPFLITMTPTFKLASDWSVETVEGLSSTVSVLAEREGAGSVKVCVMGKCLTPRWSNFLSDNHWVWSNVDVGKKQSHVTVTGNARTAVYVYGGQHRHGYGTAGICHKGETFDCYYFMSQSVYCLLFYLLHYFYSVSLMISYHYY